MPETPKDSSATEPTSEKLARALEEAKAPTRMIADARAGHYDDYRSPSPFPIMLLVRHCEQLGLHDVARRAREGEFDGTREEAEAWFNSPEGQQVMEELGRP